MKDEDIAGIARSWWKTFMEPETGEARATRARLRRTHGWQQAMLEPAAIVLARRLGVTEHERRLRMALGLASVLAHVKENTPRPLMRELGFTTTPTDKSKGDPPRLAPARFTRLLRSTPGELPLALIRLVRLAGGTANVGELAAAMMNWTHEASREAQRRRWAFDYYAASADAPDADTHSDPHEAEGTFA